MTSRIVTLTLHPAIDRVIRIRELIPGATFNGAEELRVPAGKGVNTARVLKGLLPRANIIPCAWIGENEARWYERALARLARLNARLCSRPCATRFAQTFLEQHGRETHIKEAMPPPSAAERKTFEAFWMASVSHGDSVAVCGSAPGGLGRRTALDIFRTARERGARFIMADTNGELLRAAAESRIDLLKGNAAEIGALLNLSTPLEIHSEKHRAALLRTLEKSRAPRAILVTLGARGAILAQGGKIIHAAAPRLPARFKMVSATGCGDAATAGVLWSVLLNQPGPGQMLSRAVACGTAKLSSADPGHLDTRTAQAMVRYCRTQPV